MLMKNEYLADVKEYIRQMPQPVFDEIGCTSEQLLNDPDKMELLWTLFQKNVEEYGCTEEWSFYDALQEAFCLKDNYWENARVSK